VKVKKDQSYCSWNLLIVLLPIWGRTKR